MATTVIRYGIDCFKWQRPYTKGKVASSTGKTSLRKKPFTPIQLNQVGPSNQRRIKALPASNATKSGILLAIVSKDNTTLAVDRISRPSAGDQEKIDQPPVPLLDVLLVEGMDTWHVNVRTISRM
jgi:hypothetical protein